MAVLYILIECTLCGSVRNEAEMLFPPYSAFQVVSVQPDQILGDANNPKARYVLITLLVAIDNKSQPDNLPLAPWSWNLVVFK